MAGFEVSTYGRIWVSTEDHCFDFPRLSWDPKQAVYPAPNPG